MISEGAGGVKCNFLFATCGTVTMTVYWPTCSVAGLLSNM